MNGDNYCFYHLMECLLCEKGGVLEELDLEGCDLDKLFFIRFCEILKKDEMVE
jgi:hypothetical protein